MDIPEGGPPVDMPPPVARGTVIFGSVTPPVVVVSARVGWTPLP